MPPKGQQKQPSQIGNIYEHNGGWRVVIPVLEEVTDQKTVGPTRLEAESMYIYTVSRGLEVGSWA